MLRCTYNIFLHVFADHTNAFCFLTIYVPFSVAIYFLFFIIRNKTDKSDKFIVVFCIHFAHKAHYIHTLLTYNLSFGGGDSSSNIDFHLGGVISNINMYPIYSSFELELRANLTEYHNQCIVYQVWSSINNSTHYNDAMPFYFFYSFYFVHFYLVCLNINGLPHTNTHKNKHSNHLW